MRRTFAIGLGAVLIPALLAVLAIGLDHGRRDGSPYLSALSDLAATNAYAASHPHCFRTCTTKNTCTTGTLPTVCLTSNGVCSTGTCR